MTDKYLIKIESAIISSELITDLANRIDNIHNHIQNSSDSEVNYTFKKKNFPENTVHTKEEFLNLRIPNNLENVSIDFYSNSKRLKISLNVGYPNPDSKIEVSSDDKV